MYLTTIYQELLSNTCVKYENYLLTQENIHRILLFMKAEKSSEEINHIESQTRTHYQRAKKREADTKRGFAVKSEIDSQSVRRLV